MPARAIDALHAIPPDLAHDAWVKAGMAFHAAGGDFETFDQWSSPGATYNAADCRSTWRSFKTAPGGVGAGTLYSMARAAGWIDTNKPAAKAKPRPVEPPKAPRPGMGAAEVYSRLEPATNGNGYITAKGAQAAPMGALRTVPADDPLTIAG